MMDDKLVELGLIEEREGFLIAGPLKDKLNVFNEDVDFLFYMYKFKKDNDLYAVIEKGNVRNSNIETMVRIHSACFMGDTLEHRSCECGIQLENALHYINLFGNGLLIYCINHEGRAIGHFDHFLSYLRQQYLDEDTFTSFTNLGHKEDERDYNNAVKILLEYNIKKIKLMSSNPDKINAIKSVGIEVIRMPLEFPNPYNYNHFIAKSERSFIYTPSTLSTVKELLLKNKN